MRRLAWLSLIPLLSLSACGSAKSSNGGAPDTTLAGSTYAIVPDREVTAGLDAVKALGSAAALDVDALYKAWFAIEGTVRARDKDRYLDIEDALAGVKAEHRVDTIKQLGTAIDAYLQAHPGDGSEPPLTTLALKPKHTVAVRLDDYELSLPFRLQRGVSKFVLNNHSAHNATHEMVIFRTELDAKSLPVDTKGRINEKGAGITHVTEVENVKPGADGKLIADLAPGHYVFACNIDDHYRRGMATNITVA